MYCNKKDDYVKQEIAYLKKLLNDFRDCMLRALLFLTFEYLKRTSCKIIFSLIFCIIWLD